MLLHVQLLASGLAVSLWATVLALSMRPSAGKWSYCRTSEGSVQNIYSSERNNETWEVLIKAQINLINQNKSRIFLLNWSGLEYLMRLFPNWICLSHDDLNGSAGSSPWQHRSVRTAAGSLTTTFFIWTLITAGISLKLIRCFTFIFSL